MLKTIYTVKANLSGKRSEHATPVKMLAKEPVYSCNRNVEIMKDIVPNVKSCWKLTSVILIARNNVYKKYDVAFAVIQSWN